MNNSLRWLYVVGTLYLLPGCANVQLPTPVPGASTYCIETISTQEFRQRLRTSDVAYGPYKRYVIGGHSAICDLNRFYTLTIKFETTNGRTEDLSYDLAELMRQFQEGTPSAKGPFRLYIQPKVEVRYSVRQIDLVYKVVEYQEGSLVDRIHLVKPPVVSEFPIMTYQLQAGIATH